MRVCLGGTFDVLHDGHRILLNKAFEVGDEVFIGLTSQAMAQRGRTRRVRPFPTRKKELETFLQARGWQGTVAEITHPFGRAADEEYDAIVVSAETKGRVKEINAKRKEEGLKPLKVFEVPFAYGEDGLPISATRVRAGDIDAHGSRRKPLRVAVGTANRLKRDAVDEAFRRMFPALKVTVRAFDVETGVPEQPTQAEAAQGALQRAEGALEAWKTAEYGVGVEAGIVRDAFLKERLDVQYCAVADRRGTVTTGHGGGFVYPPDVLKEVLAGKTVSDVLGPRAGDKRIGSTTGAIGWLTRGAVDRKELTMHGVLMALVPRVRPEEYA